jgi:tetratricopeptide (TPR) repeat protein
MAQVWQDIGWISFRRGNFGEAQQCYQSALSLVENTDSKEVIASVYNRLGGVAYNQGDWQAAVGYLRKSINLREAIGDVVGLASSSNNLGCLEVEMGMLGSALEDLTRNYELVTRLGQVEGVAVAYNNLGWLSILRGEPEEAKRALQIALEMASQIGFSSLHHEVLKNVGELYLETEAWDQAIQVLLEVKQSFEALGATDQLLNVCRMLSEAYLGKGDLAEANAWLHQAVELLKLLSEDGQAPPALLQGEILSLQGVLAATSGDFQAAALALDQSRSVFKRMSSTLYQGKVAYYSGRLAELQGDSSAAQQHYRQAEEIFERIGAKLEARRAARAAQAG